MSRSSGTQAEDYLSPWNSFKFGTRVLVHQDTVCSVLVPFGRLVCNRACARVCRRLISATVHKPGLHGDYRHLSKPSVSRSCIARQLHSSSFPIPTWCSVFFSVPSSVNITVNMASRSERIDFYIRAASCSSLQTTGRNCSAISDLFWAAHTWIEGSAFAARVKLHRIMFAC